MMTPTTTTTDRQRRFLVAIAAFIALFAATFLYATYTSYPEWMWMFVMLGLVVPPIAIAASLLLLLQNRRRA